METSPSKMIWNEIEKVVQEMITYQHEQLLKYGREIIPTLTPEDILQPNDYPNLEYNPYFRYEEGVLAGLKSLQMALQALKRQSP